MLFTTRVIAGLWNMMPPDMSAVGKKKNITSIHSHAVIHMLKVHNKTEIFFGFSLYGAFRFMGVYRCIGSYRHRGHTDVCGVQIWGS